MISNVIIITASAMDPERTRRIIATEAVVIHAVEADTVVRFTLRK